MDKIVALLIKCTQCLERCWQGILRALREGTAFLVVACGQSLPTVCGESLHLSWTRRILGGVRGNESQVEKKGNHHRRRRSRGLGIGGESRVKWSLVFAEGACQWREGGKARDIRGQQSAKASCHIRQSRALWLVLSELSGWRKSLLLRITGF